MGEGSVGMGGSLVGPHLFVARLVRLNLVVAQLDRFDADSFVDTHSEQDCHVAELVSFE